VAALRPHLRPGDRVLVPRAEGARQELIEGLRALGGEVDEVTLYRAAVPKEAPAEALSLLREGGIDIVTFTSSSTVRNLAALLGEDVECLRKPLVACIGPITTKTARELGLRVDVEASEYTVPGLVQALREGAQKITGLA
jgi:uroporphyrinogen III methyltransferase/synthase